MFAHYLKQFPFLILIATVLAASGQSVPNPGFEMMTHCPVSFNQNKMRLIKGWDQPTDGTPDYYHRCSDNVGVPESIFGYQEPRSGDAYIGLIAFNPSKYNYREYLEGALSKPLEAGRYYCVEFHVSLADNSTFSTDGLGVILHEEPNSKRGNQLIERVGDVRNPSDNILKNDSAWEEISLVYKANGGEKYLSIGNFRSDDSLRVQKRFLGKIDGKKWNFAYYFIDDISITPVPGSSACGNTIKKIRYDLTHPPFPDDPQYKKVELSSIRFPFDKDRLTPKAKDRLREVLDLMEAHPNYYLEVIGHTDVIGSEDYNIDLSRRRANSVREFLKRNGIPEFRLKAEFYGSDKPVASNDTKTGRAKNRRVEFVIFEKKYEPYKKHRMFNNN